MRPDGYRTRHSKVTSGEELSLLLPQSRLKLLHHAGYCWVPSGGTEAMARRDAYRCKLGSAVTAFVLFMAPRVQRFPRLHSGIRGSICVLCQIVEVCCRKSVFVFRGAEMLCLWSLVPSDLAASAFPPRLPLLLLLLNFLILFLADGMFSLVNRLSVCFF